LGSRILGRVATNVANNSHIFEGIIPLKTSQHLGENSILFERGYCSRNSPFSFENANISKGDVPFKGVPLLTMHSIFYEQNSKISKGGSLLNPYIWDPYIFFREFQHLFFVVVIRPRRLSALFRSVYEPCVNLAVLRRSNSNPIQHFKRRYPFRKCAFQDQNSKIDKGGSPSEIPDFGSKFRCFKRGSPSENPYFRIKFRNCKRWSPFEMRNLLAKIPIFQTGYL